MYIHIHKCTIRIGIKRGHAIEGVLGEAHGRV